MFFFFSVVVWFIVFNWIYAAHLEALSYLFYYLISSTFPIVCVLFQFDYIHKIAVDYFRCMIIIVSIFLQFWWIYYNTILFFFSFSLFKLAFYQSIRKFFIFVFIYHFHVYSRCYYLYFSCYFFFSFYLKHFFFRLFEDLLFDIN